MSRSALYAAAVLSIALGLLPGMANSQVTPEQTQQLRNAIGTRVEALTILGGDFGLSDGSFKSTESGMFRPGEYTDTQLDVTKIGGAGDIGDPQPLGDAGIGWQPRVQGNMGYLESTNHIHGAPLEGDTSTFRDFAIQFGGGARFWLNEELSLAPTLMVMYGHTSNAYTVASAFMRTNLARVTQLGLVDWRVETWALRPALDVQYLLRWDRLIITLASDSTYFRIHSFTASNPGVAVDGNSGSWANKVDVDIPLRVQWNGHELRTGGYFSRTELFGDLKDGLDVQHINELHGRLVLDYLNQFWKLQWVGIGGSYLWGTNIRGWTLGADVAFRF